MPAVLLRNDKFSNQERVFSCIGDCDQVSIIFTAVENSSAPVEG